MKRTEAIRVMTLLIALMQILTCAATDDGSMDMPRTGSDAVSLPSVEAGALCSHVDNPIDYSTGRATINFPLHTIECGEISLPLSLSYQTGGIKAEDEEGPVGLGWTLNCGGIVSLKVIGLPDSLTRNNLREMDDFHTVSKMYERELDTDFDRYYWNAGDYSGVFVMVDTIVVQLVETDCVVEKTGAGFNITVPDGTVYAYTLAELLHYRYNPEEEDVYDRRKSYTATSQWRLTSITGPTGVDVITLEYDEVDDLIRYKGSKNSSYWVKNFNIQHPLNTHGFGNRDTVQPRNIYTYSGRLLPSRISSRFGEVRFTHSGSRITGMDILNNLSYTVKSITFEYGSSVPRQSGQGAALLTGYTVSSGGVIIDNASFDYFPAGVQGKDYFGYNNFGRPDTEPPVISGSIGPINPDPSTPGLFSLNNIQYASYPYMSVYCLTDSGLRLNPERLPYCPEETGLWFGARGGALKGYTTSSGLETVLEYEPARFQSERIPENMAFIGLRLKSETITDHSSSMTRIRRFHYSDPVLSIQVDSLPLEQFISLSGLTASPPLDPLHDVYFTTGVVFHDCSRAPGESPENASVHYAKVTEEVTGTGMEESVWTTYEYDLDSTRNPYVHHRAPDIPENDYHYCGTRIYDTGLIPCFQEGALRVLTPKIVCGYHMETFGYDARLRKTIKWRGDPEQNDTLSVTENSYSELVYPDLVVGCYVENLKRSRLRDGFVFREPGYTSIEDFQVFPVHVRRRRSYLDSTRVTEYDTHGTSRTIATRYEYNNHRRGSDLANNGLLCKSVTTCGSDSVSTNYVYASTNGSGVMADRRISLPVRTEITHGSLTAKTENSYTNIQGRLLLTSRRIRVGAHTLDSLSILSFDNYANPTCTTRNGGTPAYYTWGNQGTQLDQVRTGSSLTTRYYHFPLVGCTGIVSPSGMVTGYVYRGARVSEVHVGGDLVEKRDYELYGQGINGINSYKVTAVRNPSQSGGIVSYARYDGFGNEFVSATQAPGMTSVLTLRSFDALGRATREYMPAPLTDHTYLDLDQDVVASYVKDYYINTDTVPWKAYTYPPCADSRAVSGTIGGAGYAAHPVTYDYSFNGPSICRRYRAVAGGILFDGYFHAGELECTTATDGDGRETSTYADYRGRVVLTRSCLDHDNADTYYIYDDADCLVCVLTPEASRQMATNGSLWAFGNSVLRNYAYRYVYDNKLRMISKLMPGREEIRYWYDATGRCILTQDGNQRQAGRVRFEIPDEAGRPAVDGLCLFSTALVDVVQSCPVKATRSNVSGTMPGYTCNAPMTGVEAANVYYYDNHTHLALDVFTSLSDALPDSCANQSRQNNTGLLTGHLCRVYTSVLAPYNNGSMQDYVAETYFYDYRERLVTTARRDHKGHLNLISATYNNNDMPLTASKTHAAGEAGEERISYAYTYDNYNRPLSVSLTRLGDTMPLQAWRYNAIGLVDRETLGEGSHIWRSYLTNGAFKALSTATMTQSLGYYDSGVPSYSGNVSCMVLRDSHSTLSFHTYYYDGMDRLVKCMYAETQNGRSGVNIDGVPDYTTEYAYDLNSNPLSIKRKGVTDLYSTGGSRYMSFGLVDDLTLAYDGNRLRKATDFADPCVYYGATDFDDGSDASEEYTYDANGNMTSDHNKGIVSVSYNPLNLPSLVTFQMNEKLAYTYDADGNLLHIDGLVSVRDHLGMTRIVKEDRYGDFIYSDTLKRIDTLTGYISSDTLYHYIKDYQGNIRQVIDTYGNLVQENYYYPFGTLTAESTDILNGYVPNIKNDNTCFYGSKEFIAANGLNLYNFTGRYYDSNLLVFIEQDPSQENYYPTSSHLYCLGNPVKLIDPSGFMPTESEAARMADYVYQDEKIELTGGWQVSDITDYNYNESNGLKSMLFERILSDGTKEYALAFAGTDLSSITDFALDALQDIGQILGLSSQYKSAMKISKQLVSKFDSEITFVGHSLGGGLSAVSAYETNRQAITFNAAGVSPFTRYNTKVSDIHAYITRNDPLDYIQRIIGLRADGNIVIREPKPEFNGHEIKNFY